MTTTAALTIADLNAMTERDEWLGFGYLGERRNREGLNPELVAEADMKAVDEANRLGLTFDQLFAWANSTIGRWYGDCMFGANGQHADSYLPGKRGY